LFAYLLESNPQKSLYYYIGISVIILTLVAAKYLSLFEKTFFDLTGSGKVFRFENLLPVLGISYITFKHISYLTDIKWKIIQRGSFDNFLFYSSFFTIYTAGPIERFERFKPQAEIKQKFSTVFLESGFERIVLGLFKKLVIADWLSYLINPVLYHKADYPMWLYAVSVIGFSIQLYLDFSGYSDIAIGASRLFGIKIMENFDYPYIRSNISDFWRHWHISLSDWIRDYLFFPFSNFVNNKIWRMVFVPVIVMAICGFWHGAEWHFVLWGMWHGAGLAVYQIWNNYKRKNKKLSALTKTKWFNVLSIIFTFLFVTAGWLLFI
jgi:alginate O-acetyltransferase complex protein AlgI